MPARTVVHVRNGENVTLLYGKKNPANGAYFDNTKLTAVAVELVKPDGTVLVPTNAPVVTYTTTAGGWKGYRVTWNPGTDLNLLPWVLAVLYPTRSGVPAALAGAKEYELDLSDLAKRQDEIEADVDALQADFTTFKVTNQGEHDATQAAVVLLDVDLDVLLARLTAARAAKLDRDLAEKADITAATAIILPEVDRLEEELGTSLDAPNATGTVHAKIRAGTIVTYEGS